MKQTKLHILLFAMALLTFVSCDRQDGDWDAMKWRTDVPMVNNVVPVSAEGGTYKFEYKNYNSFWIHSVRANGVAVEEGFGLEATTGEWFDVKVQGNVLEVTIKLSADDYGRILNVGVQAGNSFDKFTFEQDGINLPLR